MAANQPEVVVEGLENLIERDLSEHKSLLERTNQELIVYRTARSHEIQKKRHYASLVGGGKYNDDALRTSMDDININIRHMSDKAQAAEEKIAFETNIVDALTEQLSEQYKSLDRLNEQRRKDEDGLAD